MKKIETNVVVEVKYSDYNFDSLIEAVDFAKTCIRKGEKIDYKDVKIEVTFSAAEGQEEEDE